MNTATYKILFNNIDATTDIAACLKTLEYTDNINGQSDSVEITLDNQDGIFTYEWMPKKGSSLEVQYFINNKTLNCGIFQVDEIEAEGSRDGGDTVVIKGLGAGIKEAVRTIKSTAHENKSLRQVVNSIAAKFGYTVIGNIPSITIGRLTQHRETDLHFLDRLATEYGLTFSVRGKQLVFHSIFDMEAETPVLSFKKSDLESYHIKDKTTHTYLESQYMHYAPRKKKKISFTTTEGAPASFNAVKASDFLMIPQRTENNQQAELKSRVALHLANTLEQEGHIVTIGTPELVAGINIQLEQLGWLSGKYHITQSKHSIMRESGYKTDCEIKRIGVIAAALMKQ